MQRLPKIILLSGLILIVFVDFLMGFVPFYKGVQRPVGAGVVSVYPVRSGASEPVTVPVEGITGSGLERVEVYLANEYEYRIWRLTAVMNFYLVGGTLVLWLAAEWLVRPRGETLGK